MEEHAQEAAASLRVRSHYQNKQRKEEDNNSSNN